MKNYKKLWKYGLLRRMRRGHLLSILLTLRCNYDCEYCTVKMPTGKRKEYRESTLSEWIQFIDHFPIHLREIHITGGEPTLKDYVADLTNHILSQGKMVTLFTNLRNLNRILKINPSPRFRIHASFHRSQAHKVLFEYNYSVLKSRGYQITVDEIEVKILDIPSEVKRLITDSEELKTYDSIRAAPDLTMYPSCFELW